MLVDVNAALEELGLDLEDFVDFMDDLKEFLDEAMPNLKTVCESKDFGEISAQAHAIKGALANLRFVHSADIAKKLEFRGRESQDDNLLGLHADLEKSLADSFEEIK